jgi:hypothetical protein
MAMIIAIKPLQKRRTLGSGCEEGSRRQCSATREKE